MIKKLSIFLVLMMCFQPCVARADIDALQKIQNVLEDIQNKVHSAQEKIQEIKDKAKSLAEGAQGMVSDVQKSINEAVNGVKPDMKMFSKRNANLPTGDVDNDEMNEAIDQEYLPDNADGNAKEVFEEQQEKNQEVMRDVVSKIYALAFTARVQLQHEDVKDDDMSDSREMKQKANDKAIEMVERLSKILILESAIQEYLQTQSIATYNIQRVNDEGDE